MIPLLIKVLAMEKILVGELPKKEKIIQASQQLSGLELNKLTARVLKKVEREFVELNAILNQYCIKTFEDYSQISGRHLDTMLRGLNRVCWMLKKFHTANNG
jgi:hypothetical protein